MSPFSRFRHYFALLRSYFFSYYDGLFIRLIDLDTDRAKSSKVLLIRVDAIGDFILWFDTGKILVKHYQQQGKQVHLLGNHTWAEWARDMHFADQVLAIDIHRFVRDIFYRTRWLRHLARAEYAVVIQTTYSRTFSGGDALVRASRAPIRIGSQGNYSNQHVWQKRISDSWYTQLIAASSVQQMELQRHAEFLQNFGIGDGIARIPTLPHNASNLCIDLSAIPQPYAVLFPGASWSGRQWPLSRFAQLAQRLNQAHGLHIVVAGGPQDCGAAQDIVQQLPFPCSNFAGSTSLTQLRQIIQHAKLVLTNETSAVHLAAAVGTPAVCVLGGGALWTFFALYRKHTWRT